MSQIIRFEKEELNKADQFAVESQSETFSRLKATPAEEVERIRAGKLGEIAFAKYLISQGKEGHGSEDMFTIWEGQSNVDKQDFKTADGRSIDIKSAHQPFHVRILVPVDQIEQQPKDFYVGVFVRLNAGEAEIMGYATQKELLGSQVRDYGLGPAYAVFLKDLQPIDNLVALM